ncbi:DUF4349 domain-containing protein [Sphingomonas psychrotolerans]|uniref:DUF4349 domain-containing protein n=1 Tax=Sphingomonas psychrotolerans TaxID=1327635 RepID=A0ABU3N1V8_9SPHN|nr:DUF4349 domain-containing protein [Sphingomonas psychrotolerans]
MTSAAPKPRRLAAAGPICTLAFLSPVRNAAILPCVARAIAAEGGRAAETTITADDVSKDVVDTEARIRQREILVTRLTDMLRNRQGRVSELAEAERSVAVAQEELDQAKGWRRECAPGSPCRASRSIMSPRLWSSRPRVRNRVVWEMQSSHRRQWSMRSRATC